MLPPNTASPNRSIWKTVGQNQFENNVDRLSKTNFIPEPHVLPKKDWPKQSGDYALPFDVEKQLADDFAFIAAYDYGVQYVTVATVQASKDSPNSTTVRLAANEGVNERAKDAISKVLAAMQRCASKELKRQTCAEEILDVVVKLNQNRILGRLDSRYFKPNYMCKKPNLAQLPIRLKQQIEDFVPRRRSRMREGVQELSEEVNQFHQYFNQLEYSTVKSERVGVLMLLVKQAFKITRDGFSFPSRLSQAVLNIRQRDISEITKIANYWRISQELSNISRSYRRFFQDVGLEALPRYRPFRSSGKESVFEDDGDNAKGFVH
ncbi:hypothetical protein BDY21DRAFT_375180 [Lineolata rhizophorae]|uniref:Uncharacterized protein n=1 Tax=Lineolata rhizophorae TaxID=578093 RepID=A0A6A6NMW1_9PEZI|nr:hypothetical protein BDY21DRAFT_375180 [Lineolata rhizophorae]